MGSRPRKVRGRSGSTRRRQAARGDPPETGAVIPEGLRQRLAPRPAPGAGRLAGSHPRATGGRAPRGSRHPGTAGLGWRATRRGTASPGPPATRVADAGGRLAPVRAPGATGRSPGADGRIPRVTRAPARPRAPAGARPSLPGPAGHRRAADAVTGPNPNPNLNPNEGPGPGWNRPSGTAPRTAPVPAAMAGEPTTPGLAGRCRRWSAVTSARVRHPPPAPRAGCAPRPARPPTAGPAPAPSPPGGPRPSRSARAVAARRASLRALDLTVTSGGPQTGSPPAGAPAVRLPGRPPASRRPIPGPVTRRSRAGGPAAGLLCGRRRGTMMGTRTRSRQDPPGAPGHPGRGGRRGPGAGPAGAAAAGRS